jgi:Na+/melibiose symporter-like transporter
MEKCCGGPGCCDNQRTLTGARLVGFAFGTFGQMAPIGLYNTFAAYYYIWVLGAKPLPILSGVFLSLLAFAFSSPIFGALLDNKKPGRIGKRRPFLLLGVPFMLLFITLIWTPPSVWFGTQPNTITSLYFGAVAIGLEIAQGLLVSTYLSMMSEQSTDPDNRVKIASLQGIFSILGTVLSILMPMILKSVASTGAMLEAIMPWIGVIFGALGAASFLIVFFSTDERFLQVELGSETPRRPLVAVFKEIFVAWRDPQFKWWLGNAFFFNMSIRFLIFLLIPIMEFVIVLQQNQFMLFFGCLLPVAAGGYIIWIKKIKATGLKGAYGLSLLVNVLFSSIAIIFLIPMDFVLRFIIGIVVLGMLVSALVGGYLFPNPIVSRLVDLAPLEIKKEASRVQKGLSGSYFGLYILVYNLAHAIANLSLGFIFTDQNKEDPLLITAILPVTGLIVFISWLFLRKIQLPKTTTAFVAPP